MSAPPGASPIIVTTADGAEIRAATALEALRALNQRALVGEPDAWRYMLRVAERARRVTGCLVRSEDPATFLRDMAAAGLLQVEGLDEPGGGRDASR